MCSRERVCVLGFFLKDFYLFSKGGTFVGVLRGGWISIEFITFTDRSFNMLMHQNEYIVHSLVNFTFKEGGLGTEAVFPQHGLECITPCNLLSA